jgi:hypothetical protein
MMAAVAYVLPAYATDVPTDMVVLGGLDKVSGRVSTFEAMVGQKETFGNLEIMVRACITHPPEERPENSAFLEITLNDPKSQPRTVFTGWMFSSNPAISAMDDPVYDVWVLRCENSKASKSP